MIIEVWKDIPNYIGVYQVSSIGRVKSLQRYVKNRNGFRVVNECVLRSRKDRHGYEQVGLNHNGERKTFQVHRLVAMAFLNHTPKGHHCVVDHINENRLDNRVENLRITTNRDNVSRSKKGSSRYTGVSWHKKNGKWSAKIRINGRKKHLGYFDCEYNAHLSYLEELSKLKYE